MTLGDCKEGDVVWIPDGWYLKQRYKKVEIIGRMTVDDEPTSYILYKEMDIYGFHNYSHESLICYKENPEESKENKL